MQFTVLEETENQQIFTFKELQPVHVNRFGLSHLTKSSTE